MAFIKYLWTFLILACILVPLVYVLYFLGILVTRARVTWFFIDLSLPTRWEGHSAGAASWTSGFMRRNFVVFKKYRTLAIEVETNSGALDFEINAPDGSALSPTSGVYGRDASILIDVSRLKRCSVTLRMDRFNGQFRIALQ